MNTKTVHSAATPPIKHWDAEFYDSRHTFVSHLATDLLRLLNPQAGEQILDLGCGTGHLSYKITACGAEVVGIDSSASMIKKAHQTYPNLSFAIADGTNLDWYEQFDAVFSNAVLHWIKPPEKVVVGIWRALKPGGRFVAEFGGKGNVNAILTALYQALDEVGYPQNKELNPWYFPSIAEYGTILENKGFHLKIANLIDRPTRLEDGEKGLRNWIRMFAGTFLQNIPPDLQNKVISMVEQKLRPQLYHHGSWVADYKRIRIVAVKLK